jgi:hypothetical protein
LDLVISRYSGHFCSQQAVQLAMRLIVQQAIFLTPPSAPLRW